MPEDQFNILYVDDEEQNLISFKAAFRRYYKIHTASSGFEGIKVLKNHDINLVITDQRMPEMTGVEFLEKILPAYPDTIRMILTGFSDIDAIIQAINSGRVFRYITKPWDENELKMTIENARQLFQLQQKNKHLLNDLQLKVQEQEKILKLFMKYVPEPVIEKALNTTEESIFEGELREISVLFCDIRGFTPLSEILSPKEVVSFLNDYYSIMSSPIKKHNGMINQFVGDEIFAAFGAPLLCANNEQNAVFCAIDMMEALNVLNDKYRDKLSQPIQIGIGINSGEVITGNLGTEDRINYSVTGDTVNTGKRIEMLTKNIPDTILISDNIYQKVNHLIKVKPWDPIQVKGKKDKLHVYEVIGRA
ncbi:MAG: adenylate/guanylate cyclase domain-containing protein [Candidatus Cyclobacteriaceae bacterium M3_2C_046]